MKAKIIKWGVVSMAFLGLIGWKLIDNKNTLNRKAELSLAVNTVIPVIVEKPQHSVLDCRFSINGQITADREVMVLSKAQGIVTKKNKKLGDVIPKGSVIAQLENSVVRGKLRAAEEDCMKAKKDVERYLRLVNSGAVTIRELEENELTLRNVENRITELKDQLANTSIIAPITGSLSEDFIEEGSFMTIGDKVATILSNSGLKMQLSVTEKEMLQLARGNRVIVTADVFPGESYSGIVDMISPQGNDLHTYLVEIIIQGNKKRLKPGMYATAIFNPTEKTERKTIISRKAIVGGMKSPHVWIVKEGKAYEIPVETGLYSNEYIEITKGISLDDTVVNSGQINLSEGFEVSILNR